MRAGIKLDPETPGTIEMTGTPKGPVSYAFVPSAPLRPDTVYKLVVSGVRDQDGLVLAPQSIAVRTVKAPGVIRFRPREDATGTPRDANISVRFTEAMDRSATAKAFSVKIGGKAIKGKISWAESNTVLVFDPASALPYDAAIVAKVDITAKSAAGASMIRSTRAIFETVPKPKPVRPPTVKISSGGGGGAVGGGSWAAVERFYLGLMNCTRQGGWVTSGGSCSSPGGRNVAALKLDSGISSRVARPYAKLLATRGACTPLHRWQPREPSVPRRIQQLPMGREHRLPFGQSLIRRPGLASLLPEREVVPRRSLRQPHERGRTTGSGSVSGSRRGGCDWWSTSTTPDRTFGWLDGAVQSSTIRRVIRNAVLHIMNEQPMLADLFETPEAR